MRTTTSITAKYTSKHANTLENWNYLVSQCYSGTTIDADEALIFGTFHRFHLNQITVADVTGSSQKVSRWANRPARRDSGTTYIHIQDTGHSITRQGAKCTSISRAQATVYDPDSHYSIEFPDDFHVFLLEIPTQLLLSNIPDFDPHQYNGMTLPSHFGHPVLALLNAISVEVQKANDNANWYRWLGTSLEETLVGALNALKPRGSSAMPMRAPTTALGKTVIAKICSEFANPDLSSTSIAHDLGVSRRNVQRVFEQLQTTASAFILNRRLLAAAQQLRHLKSHRVIDIALDCGFADSTHFARCFKQRYGVSPSEYRKAQ